jgi:hypothetical protein
LAGAKIKISLDKFFDNLNKIFNVGMDFGKNIASTETVILESKSYFYNNTFLYDFGEVLDFSLQPDKEFAINTLAIGYRPNEYESKINGKYEFNLEQNWNFPITKQKQKGDYVSDWRADVYGWTFTSLNLENKTTTEGSSDNSIFIVHSETTTDVHLDKNFDEGAVTGFPYPEYIFNYKLTPKRNLLRWGNVFHSICFYLESQLIKFGTASQNKDLVLKSDDELLTVTESEDITVEDLFDILFQPYIFNIDVVVSPDFDATLYLNKQGYCTFTFEGNVYKFYIIDVEINQKRKTTFQIKGRSHPDNNLSLLSR